MPTTKHYGTSAKKHLAKTYQSSMAKIKNHQTYGNHSVPSTDSLQLVQLTLEICALKFDAM